MDRKAIAIVAMGMPLQSAYRCRAPGLRFAYSAAFIAVLLQSHPHTRS